MTSASCRRLLINLHHPHRQQTTLRLLQVLSNLPQRSLCTSWSLNKLNQPKLREEDEHTDVTHPPLKVPPDRAVQEDGRRRSHDLVVASTVDGVFREQYPDESQHETEGVREEGEEEVAQTELSLRKLTSIYLKLSKSRLTGNSCVHMYMYVLSIQIAFVPETYKCKYGGACSHSNSSLLR